MTFLSSTTITNASERPTSSVEGRTREASLTITSFAHERLHVDAKESDQALFEYKLDRDDDGNRSLFAAQAAVRRGVGARRQKRCWPTT